MKLVVAVVFYLVYWGICYLATVMYLVLALAVAGIAVLVGKI